ncbi:vacuolar cation/proton exchanger 3-like [Impatiens glandulifera]|uniref:vacuolar cation/proton exchanger 3-like n=1 Tax=Impatiens glandulifera TaxID=253017 RepID=UPI001FB19ED3|nr:vacuolar cation/proton exchanger 3-like [Impatiens glandulifera]
MGSHEDWSLENGDLKDPAVAAGISKENSNPAGAGRTAQNVSVSLVRKKSDPSIGSKFQRFPVAGKIVVNVQEVILGTKLFILFPAIPLAIIAQSYDFGRPWIFALSLLGLTPLAERVSFLTEQIAFYTGPTVGGLLNATCGNATELIIAILALQQRKINVVKYSLMGSILSNLLLVLGSSLFCGGLANLKKEQRFDKRQSDVNTLLLLLGVLCILLPLLFKYAAGAGAGSLVGANAMVATSILQLSRACSIMMLLAYITYLVFQLKTHKQLFDAQAEQGMIGDINDGVSSEEEEEKAAIGFWSAFGWLVGMTLIIALLSEYVVGTIEAASDSWGISVSFISLILLPIVGNAAEHAGSVIFALKNKLDISLGVALGSAAQISMFVVPLCAVVAWVMGVPMNLDFDLLETGVLTFSVILIAFTLQDGTSHYMKGVVLCLSYAAIAACFFVHNNTLPDQKGTIVLGVMVA